MRFIILLCFFIAISYSKSIGPWNINQKTSSNKVIPVSFALTIRNEEWLQNKVIEVSDPKNPNWRNYLTKEQLMSKIAPSRSSVDFVINYLQDNGMKSYNIYPSGDFIMTYWKVSDIEQLLKVSMNEFIHKKTNDVIDRSLIHYTLPRELYNFVDIIGMISEFPEDHLRSRTSNSIVPPRINNNKEDDTCNSVLNWGYPATSDTDIYSQVQIVCCDGQFTTNLTAPCFGHGPQLLGIQTTIYANKTGRELQTSLVAYEDMADNCFLDGSSITCSVPFTPTNQVQPFQNYQIYAVGIFTEEEIGQPSGFPVKLVTSPFVTPQVFNEYYNIPSHWNKRYPTSGNSQSVVEFGGQYYSPDDLKHFFGNMSLPNTLASISGPNDANNPGDEATLDIEWIMAVGVEIDTVFWSVQFGYLLEWTQQLFNDPNTPLVNSVSYGGNESNSPSSYKTRVDLEFQKLATIGVSIVVSSGDAGATNVGHGSDSCSNILPQYPASSPFVTSVSATFFTPSDVPMCSISYYGKQVHCSDVHVGEIAVSADDGMDWTTGGGFSDYVSRPSWQTTAVNNYLSTYSDLLPPSSMFNSTNRAYPDVSAIGHNLMLILRDKMDIGDGTSASTPIFAGVLALLNQYLLSIGEQPLGFANPLLYQIAEEYPSSFYDVTIGNNACGDVLHPPYIACCDNSGYKSSLGWDPVTGLGTPRFISMFSAVENLVKQQKQNTK